MGRWSPGRYGVFDFAKNVQEVRAVADGAARQVTRVNDQTWSVSPLGVTRLTVSYKVLGNDLFGTFSQLAQRHANVNSGLNGMIFRRPKGQRRDPVKPESNAPVGWKIPNGRTDRLGQTEKVPERSLPNTL